MKKEKIYILQMHTKTIPSKFVRLFTRYEYSHIALSLTNSCDLLYSFGRKSLRNALNGGFVIENKNGKFFNKFSDTVCRVYELEIEQYQYNKIKEILSSMEENSGNYKYDFLGAFLGFFHIHISFKNKYICSTFVATLLHKSGAYVFKKDLCLIKPKDFENIKGAKITYLGEYKNLISA